MPLSTSPSRVTPKAREGLRPRVLLVEDNLADAFLVREAIDKEGLLLEIHAAVDGEMAVRFIERAEHDPEAPSPDAVILDLNLPKVDGFEVLRRIRASQRFCKLPVLVLTSSESRADRREGVKLGASYFSKRADYTEFLKIGAAIRSLLEENALLP